MRILSLINLAGLLSLTVLCLSQWKENGQLNHELGRLESIRIDQTAKLDVRDGTIRKQARDLDQLQSRLTVLTGDFHTTEEKLLKEEAHVKRLNLMVEGLEDNLGEWKDAVELRDERIEEAREQIGEMVSQLSETVMKYNELAEHYNETVGILNERTEAYNDLVLRYNELAESQ